MKVHKDIEASAPRLTPYIHKTPVLTSQALNEISGAQLFFKCENFQKMGAFKMRGATNALLQLSTQQKNKGVVTHSSGNFAQALALAAKNLGIKAHIVMPSNAPEVKKIAVKGYGGMITECEPTLSSRVHTARAIQASVGATFVHPFNDYHVILGNATVGKELLEEIPDLDIIIAPVGGGGLISGVSLSATCYGNSPQVIGAEPMAVNDAYRSLESGKIEHNQEINTIADGLKTDLGDITFNIMKNYVKEIILVKEEDIISSMQLIWERMKIIIEPSSAVTLAAILTSPSTFKGKKIGLVLSGGNVDLKKLPF